MEAIVERGHLVEVGQVRQELAEPATEDAVVQRLGWAFRGFPSEYNNKKLRITPRNNVLPMLYVPV